jgi:hypothetical protein
MATQRLTVATVIGESAERVFALFRSWALNPAPERIDNFAVALRDNALSLPVVYFCEWADYWLMGGDLVPGSGVVEGRRYQAACLSPAQALAWAERCGQQFQEQEWLAARLREAVLSWQGVIGEQLAVVVLREVVGGAMSDEEVRESLTGVPEWLAAEPS